MQRRTFLVIAPLALGVLLGPGGCGGSEAQEEELSVIVIHVTFTASVPTMYQLRVNAHIGGLTDNVLMFPVSMTTRAIQSGDTMALLLPPTRTGMVDLSISGLDANGRTVATGSGQAPIEVRGRTDVAIELIAV